METLSIPMKLDPNSDAFESLSDTFRTLSDFFDQIYRMIPVENLSRTLISQNKKFQLIII